MNEQTLDVLKFCVSQSKAEAITFPEVVRQLNALGLEYYHADLMRQETTYYFPNGETHIEALPLPASEIATLFSDKAVFSAIRASQQGEIGYNTFLKRIMQAGTTGYFVYITGKKAVYIGREGQQHIEHFPQ